MDDHGDFDSFNFSEVSDTAEPSLATLARRQRPAFDKALYVPCLPRTCSNALPCMLSLNSGLAAAHTGLSLGKSQAIWSCLGKKRTVS